MLNECLVESSVQCAHLFIFLYPYFSTVEFIQRSAHTTDRMRSALVSWMKCVHSQWQHWEHNSSCYVWAAIRVMCRHFANKRFSYKPNLYRCSLNKWWALVYWTLLWICVDSVSGRCCEFTILRLFISSGNFPIQILSVIEVDKIENSKKNVHNFFFCGKYTEISNDE